MVSKADIQQIVASVLDEVLESAPPKSAGTGVLPDMGGCVAAASRAALALRELGLARRSAVVEAMRACAVNRAEELAQAAYEETGYGSIAHKIAKCRLAAEKTPGVEDLSTEAATGDAGLVLTERAPYGVIGSITPSTNPVATVVNNAISMVAAGNAVVFAPHPGAARCSQLAISLLNEAAVQAGAPSPLLFCVQRPDVQSSGELMNHPDVRLLSITGGEAIVNLAMKTGKKVVAAGPGNPPVIVDETADIERAARAIVDGASFENNILCIAEKEVFVVESAGPALVAAMVAAGAQLLETAEAERLKEAVLVQKDGAYAINRDCVGRDAAVLLGKAGIAPVGNPRLLLAITREDHPFVRTEMLMPVLPVVFVKDVDAAIACAVRAERGCHHSAYMHSHDVRNLSRAARALDTTLFVKNGPSYAGLGFGGEGFASFTIATPTGEGITSARSFTRSRRCVLQDAFRII